MKFIVKMEQIKSPTIQRSLLCSWLSYLNLNLESSPDFFNSMTKENYQSICDKNEYKRVIEQDIMRTRIGHPFFKSTEILSVMKSSLLLFCFHYNISYMQVSRCFIKNFINFNPSRHIYVILLN